MARVLTLKVNGVPISYREVVEEHTSTEEKLLRAIFGESLYNDPLYDWAVGNSAITRQQQINQS